VSEFDLSASIEAARKDCEIAAKAYVEAQEVLVDAEQKLRDAKNKATRLERALRILNGEEEPAGPAPASAATVRQRPAPLRASWCAASATTSSF
jgi:hypothetical protein